MSASPEFYKPAPVFSPCSSPLVLRGAGEDGAGVWEENCRTPTCGESHLKAPVSCPPAPRKPRAPAAPCRKRLFEVEVFSLRLDELERLFWPQTPPPEKRRRVA